MDNDKSRLSAEIGENVFGFDLMEERLPREFHEKLIFAIRNQRPISPETADVIAHAMKEWAILKGATHYTHWFQPLTGLTAEKHDSFLSYDSSGKVIDRFSGHQLIMSEPDASSFPHGGLRSTFEARGYAAWDPSSPAFIMKRGKSATLCLPSVYVSFHGVVLDKKTPLLRSISAVSKSAVRMLRLLGNKRVTSAMPHLGAEQEYFLVDKETYEQRPDLLACGATLIGAGAARGQKLEDHYFRAIPDRVLEYMEDVERELVKLGVPVKTRHNEVAPAQFELAVLYSSVNIATDQNQLVMEILKRIAPHHGLEALLHEKPFARVNGSGKHCNWSLIDSEGVNLLKPGSNRSSRIRFLVFLMAVVRGVMHHGPLLRGIVADAGNDLRLGGNEAPPTIMSVHLGEQLNALLKDLAAAVSGKKSRVEEIDLEIAGVAKIPKDTSDRNRTSPFAFTGDKFEFRAVGSSATVSLPNAAMNAMVAQSLDHMSQRLSLRLDSGEDRTVAVLGMLGEVIEETAAIRYDGDNYTEEWLKEAKKRGLGSAGTTPEAVEALIKDSTIELFEKYRMMTREESEARYRVRLDSYVKSVSVALKVMRKMLSTQVLPAAIRYQERIAVTLNQTVIALGNEATGLSALRAKLEELTALIEVLAGAISVLSQDEKKVESDGDMKKMARFCANELRRHMDSAREASDQLEELVDAKEWPLPHYDQMLVL